MPASRTPPPAEPHIVNAALTGMVPRPERVPHVPVSPQEIVDDASRARRPDAVLCVCTSGRTFPELERRADVLSLTGDIRPDMASLTLGSLNFCVVPAHALASDPQHGSRHRDIWPTRGL